MDFIDIGLISSYALIGLCTLAAILIPLYQSFGDPKTLLKSGIGVGIMLIIFIFSYFFADGGSAVVWMNQLLELLVRGLLLLTPSFS